MSFVYKKDHPMKTTINKIKITSTLVNKQGLYIHRERTFLSARKIKGSLTIEAAIALPIFMFFVMCIIYFLVIFSLQSQIQLAMEEAARSIGKKAYLINSADDIISGESPEVDADTESLLTAGINPLTIKTEMLKDGLKERLDHSQIIDGANGLYTYNSSYDEETGFLDIVVNYNYKIPFFSKQIGTIAMAQRSFSHVWIGKRLNAAKISEDGRNAQTVYVTPYGTVYHTEKDCRYLDLSIRQISQSEIISARNADGEKYEKCTCANHTPSDGYVYVTDYGTNWHTDLNCSGLKRTVNEIEISEIGGMHICPKCEEKH